MIRFGGEIFDFGGKGWIILENNILQAACTCAKKFMYTTTAEIKNLRTFNEPKKTCYTDRRYLTHARQRKYFLVHERLKKFVLT